MSKILSNVMSPSCPEYVKKDAFTCQTNYVSHTVHAWKILFSVKKAGLPPGRN